MPQRRDVERGNEDAVDAVLDRFGQAADCRGHDGPAVRHRLARNEAVPLATRGNGDDGRTVVVGAEFARRNRADDARNARREVAGADDDEREVTRGLGELEHAFLLREPADEEDVRRLFGRDDLGRDRHPGRYHPHVAGAEGSRVSRQRL